MQKTKDLPSQAPELQVVDIPRHKHLLKITITFCNKDGDQIIRDIDLKKVGGLIWHSAAKPNSHVTTPKMPGKNRVNKGKCGPKPMDPDDPTCCYWTGARWICPEDPDE
jgi:hypothetical protein